MRDLSKETVWTENKSIRLSMALVRIFTAALLGCDVGGWWLVNFICSYVVKNSRGLQGTVVLLACLYLCSIPAYILLYSLAKLLKNLQTAHVFLPVNVIYLRRVSWCCFAAAVICFSCMPEWPSLVLVAVAAAFVGLIVRIVKNVFEKAIRMQDELDFTI